MMADSNSSNGVELAEQNDLLRKQIALVTALLESRDAQIGLIFEKFEIVNVKLESLLDQGKLPPPSPLPIPIFRTESASTDDSHILVESSEEENGLNPSSSRDYVVEARAKESYWRGTKNDQYIKSMAEEEPILVSASQFFVEMHNLRFVYFICILLVLNFF